jgi:hypothetical protein
VPAEPWGRFRWRLWIDVALGARSFGNMIAGVQIVSRKVPADSPILAGQSIVLALIWGRIVGTWQKGTLAGFSMPPASSDQSPLRHPIRCLARARNAHFP